MREPIDVIEAIIPFNSPVNLVAYKAGPVFAFGNTIVLKAASQTLLSVFFIAKLLQESILPDGALNVVASGSLIGVQMCRMKG
nr:aldehyde dehydrogenase family protein [Parageobacillus thermoglucosidasius]